MASAESLFVTRNSYDNHHPHHTPRRADRHDLAAALRALRRAPGALLLRRPVGRRAERRYPAAERLPQRRAGGAARAAGAAAALAGRLLRRPLPLARRHWLARRARRAPRHV